MRRPFGRSGEFGGGRAVKADIIDHSDIGPKAVFRLSRDGLAYCPPGRLV
jgi:hypothetical protein